MTTTRMLGRSGIDVGALEHGPLTAGQVAEIANLLGR